MLHPATPSQNQSSILELEIKTGPVNHVSVVVRCEDVIRLMEGLVAAEIGRPPTSVEYDPTESDDGVLRCYFDDTGILGVPFSAEISYGLIAESIAKKFITHPHIRGRGFHESGSWITTNEDGSICLYL